MTKTYFPFDGTDVLETQWRQMAAGWLRDGVLRGTLNELEVFADSSGMQVKVPTGAAWAQGHYFRSDAQETVAVTVADGSNPRIDRVVVRYDFTANSVDFAVVAGTPAATPAAPALTQSATVWEIPLAQVAVAAAAATIAAADVTDDRRLTGPTVVGREFIQEILLGSAAASVTFENIPQDYKHLEIIGSARCSNASIRDLLNIRFNGDTGANYHHNIVIENNSTVTQAGFADQTSYNNVITVPAASASANRYGGVRVEVFDYRAAHHKSLHSKSDSFHNDTASGFYQVDGSGLWKSTAAIDEITIIGATGNIAAGSVFTLYGVN